MAMSGNPYKGKTVLYIHMQDNPGDVEIPNTSMAWIAKVHEDGSCNLKVLTPGGIEMFVYKKPYNQASLRGCWTNLPQ